MHAFLSLKVFWLPWKTHPVVVGQPFLILLLLPWLCQARDCLSGFLSVGPALRLEDPSRWGWPALSSVSAPATSQVLIDLPGCWWATLQYLALFCQPRVPFSTVSVNAFVLTGFLVLPACLRVPSPGLENLLLLHPFSGSFLSASSWGHLFSWDRYVKRAGTLPASLWKEGCDPPEPCL